MACMPEPKLVRDLIPEMLRGLGLKPVTRVVSGKEYC
jgi:predicted house-cleaning noncanonical NTP pyrophosphatase (MazG superfamily)